MDSWEKYLLDHGVHVDGSTTLDAVRFAFSALTKDLDDARSGQAYAVTCLADAQARANAEAEALQTVRAELKQAQKDLEDVRAGHTNAVVARNDALKDAEALRADLAYERQECLKLWKRAQVDRDSLQWTVNFLRDEASKLRTEWDAPR